MRAENRLYSSATGDALATVLGVHMEGGARPGENWRETRLLQAELDGLGGSSDYFTVEASAVDEWQSKLNR